MLIKQYDTGLYRFAEILSSVFGVSKLSKLHEERIDLLPDSKLAFENESKTNFHSLVYSKINNGELQELEEAFVLFIVNEVKPFFDNDILHQYMPSFRFHLPGDMAIHKWHYDSDSEHRHPEWEITFHVPLTSTSDTQSLWIESVPGLSDYKPVNLKYGEFAIFDGNRCTHGNKENKTDRTRVSFDFRVLPIGKYYDNVKTSVTTNKRFREGDYYRRVVEVISRTSRG
jgi:hypothetical protein